MSSTCNAVSTFSDANGPIVNSSTLNSVACNKLSIIFCTLIGYSYHGVK